MNITKKKYITLFLLITTILLVGISTVSATEINDQTDTGTNMEILYATQTTHQLNENTYSTYFDDNSNLKEDSIQEGDILDLNGTICNKNFTISKSITFTSSQHNGKIINGTIRVNGVNGITISNLNITNGDDKVHAMTRGSGIIINQTNNSIIKNNYIVIQQNGVALNLARTVNSTIENNYMVTLYYHTSATGNSSHSVLVLLGANYTNINNNTVLSEGSNSIYASQWNTADLPPSAGNSYYTNITNNYVGCLVDNIGWYQGITIIGAYSNIINNTVNRSNTAIATGYSAVVIGNKLYNVTTGISNSYTASNDGNIIIGNYIDNSLRSGTTTGITASTESKIINNTIIDATTGISISSNQKNILIEKNNISDNVRTTNAGIITSGTSKANNITITNNTVKIKGPNAVKVNGTLYSIIDNYIYSSTASGNAAVIAPTDSTIKDNTPAKHLGYTSTNHNVTFGLTYNNQPQQGTIKYNITNNAHQIVKSGNTQTNTEGLLTVNINDLPVGPYTVEASYEELSIKDTFTKKYDTFITAENMTVKYGETAYVTIHVKDENGKPVNGGIVKIKEGGTTYPQATVENGEAQVRFSASAWTHNCNITYDGYGDYDASIGEVTIDVLKIGLKYIIPDKIAKPGENVSYTVNIRDENGNPVSYVGYFYVQVDGVNLTDEDEDTEMFRIYSNSNITFTVQAANEPKISTIKIIFPYDNETYYSNGPNYLDSIGMGNLVVTDKEIATIYYNTSGPDYYYLNAKVFENKSFSIRAEDESEGTPYSGYAINTNMTVYVDDINQTVEIKWGDGKLNITDLAEGNYTLKAQISDDDYASAITFGRLEVFKYNTSITAEIFYGYAGREVTVPVTVEGEGNHTVATGEVVLTIDGKQFTAKVNNGYALVPVILPAVENYYDVDLEYVSDNGWFYGSTGSTYATAINYAPTPQVNNVIITLPDVSGNVSDIVTIPITVTKNNILVEDGDVMVKLENNIFFTTVNNGIANIEIKLPNTPGAYPITATYTNGVDTATTIGFAVVKNNTVPTEIATNISLNIQKQDGQVSFSGKLVDNASNPIENSVYITLISSNADVKVYNTTTKSDGTYNLTLYQLSGEYDVEASFIGNEVYAPSTSGIKHFSTEITNTTEIDAPDLNGVYGEKNYFVGTLKDGNGNPIVGHHVALNLTRLSSGANKIYWVTTDYQGNYVLEINLAPGNYTAETIIDEDGYVGDKLSHINIARATDLEPTAISYGEYNIKYNSGESFTGKLFTTRGASIGGEIVNIKLANSKGQSKDYQVVTNAEGIFELPINLAIGTYTAICSFSGTAVYESSTSTSIIVVY